MNIEMLKLEFELLEQHLNRVEGIKNQIRALSYKTWIRQQVQKQIVEQGLEKDQVAWVGWDRILSVPGIKSQETQYEKSAVYKSRAFVIDADNMTPEAITRVVKKARKTMPNVPFSFERNPKVREILRICIGSALNEDLIDHEDFDILVNAGYLTTEN